MHQSNLELYYQSEFLHHEKAKNLIKELNLKGNEKILDIGCGDGKITAQIAAYVPHGTKVIVVELTCDSSG
ncbi:MAG: class I SAM-dependent methyltransferase [Dolichospermum sp.]